MGIFSSSKEVIVDTSAVRVIEDDKLPDAIKTGGLISLMTGNDLVKSVQDQVFLGLPSKVDAMYRYGRDTYTHGLPSGQFVSAGSGSPEIRQILADIHNVPLSDIALDYTYIQSANFFHFAWMKLIQVYGYDPVTNELPVLSASAGFTVFLDDMVLQLPTGIIDTLSHESLVQWGTPANAGPSPARKFTQNIFGLRRPTRALPVPTGTTVQALVKYSWVEPAPQVNPFTGLSTRNTLRRFSDVITIDNFNEESTYIHAKYSVGPEIKYTVYDPSTGVYPSLDNIIIPPPTIGGQFFPFTYFRFNNTPESDNPTSQSYLTNKAMVKKLGLDYDAIEESVNTAENIEFVEQAIMILAVPADTDNEIEKRYLFDFFRTIPEFTIRSRTDIINSGGHFYHSLVIQDKRFKFALEALEVRKRRAIGNIGPVGTYDLEVTSRLLDPTLGVSFDRSNRKEVHIYRYQVTPYLYEEISILDLQMEYFIYGRYTTTSFNDASIRLIPLDLSITDAYGLSDKEELYSRSLHHIFNTKQVIKIPWWQKGPFKVLLVVGTVVLIIVSIITLQIELTSVFVSALLANATIAGAYIAVALAATQLLALGIVLGFAFRGLVKLIGIEGSFIAALLLVIAHVIAPNGISFSIPSTISAVPGAPFAQSFLQLGSGLLSSIGSVIEEKIAGLAKELEELNLLKAQADEDFSRANALLERSNHLISPFIIFGESPDEYYNRTIHSGNIGVLSIDAVSNFVDISLMLPELKDLTGGNS